MTQPASRPPATVKPPFWRDPAKRALIFQLLMLAGVFGVLAIIVSNTLTNLEKCLQPLRPYSV